MTAFKLGRLTVNAVEVPGKESATYDRRETAVARGADGTTHRTVAEVTRGAPMLRFGTTAIETLIGVFDLVGAPETPFRGGAVVFDLGKFDATTNEPGFDAAATATRRHTAALAVTYLDRLSWRQGQVATADASSYFQSSNGTTDPVAETNVAYVAPAQPGPGYMLTSLTIGGQTFTRCRSYDLAIEHRGENNADECYQLGLPFPVMPTSAGINGQVGIELDVEVLDMAVAPTGSEASVVAVFTQIAQGGVIPTSTPNTLTVTLSKCMIRDVSRDAQNAPGAAGRRLKCWPRFDGTTQPLTIAV